MKARNRRYITRYNPTGSHDGTPCWEIYDRLLQAVIEGGYPQQGARLAAHFHNHQWHGDAYTKRT